LQQNENAIFSVGNTDMSQTMRLSSVWPIGFQYNSQSAATGYSCVGTRQCQNCHGFHGWATVQSSNI